MVYAKIETIVGLSDICGAQEKETQPDLKRIAQKLRETDLFVVPYQYHRMVDKQHLFLLAAGLKQVFHTTLSHMMRISLTSNEFVAVPDEPEVPATFLKELGFVYAFHTEPHFVEVYVARHQEPLQRMLQADDVAEIGRLFGYPETAVQAYKERESLCLPDSEQDELLAQLCPSEQVRKLCIFRMSKQHYKDEFETVRRWYKVLKQYDLLDDHLTVST